MQEAWLRGQPLTLHGFVYGLNDGLLNDLAIEVDSAATLEATYAQAVARLDSVSR